jgi:hypothetical protein
MPVLAQLPDELSVHVMRYLNPVQLLTHLSISKDFLNTLEFAVRARLAMLYEQEDGAQLRLNMEKLKATWLTAASVAMVWHTTTGLRMDAIHQEMLFLVLLGDATKGQRLHVWTCFHKFGGAPYDFWWYKDTLIRSGTRAPMWSHAAHRKNIKLKMPFHGMHIGAALISWDPPTKDLYSQAWHERVFQPYFLSVEDHPNLNSPVPHRREYEYLVDRFLWHHTKLCGTGDGEVFTNRLLRGVDLDGSYPID